MKIKKRKDEIILHLSKEEFEKLAILVQNGSVGTGAVLDREEKDIVQVMDDYLDEIFEKNIFKRIKS